MENVEKIAGSVKTTSYFKFDNMNDYILGITEMTTTLDEWAQKADEGFARKYNLTKHNEDMKLEIELEVTPHAVS